MRVAFLGDIALFGRYTTKSDYKKTFSDIKDRLSNCDYVIANLETPLTIEEKTIGGRSAYIKGLPEDCEILKYLNITHVTLANNHIYDFCDKGLFDTINALQKKGIQTYGIGSDYSIISDGKNKLCLRGYCCYSTNGRRIGNSENNVNSLEYDKVMSDLAIDKQNGFKSVLSIHWGTEHVHYPRPDHVRFVHDIAARYDVIIHGHHPHVIQGYEIINNSFVMYSLGNFCFDDVYTPKSEKPLIKLSKDNKTTFITIIELDNNEIVKKEVVPLSFCGDEYSVVDIQELNLREISSCFNDLSELETRGNNELKEYLSSHKKERDFKWYIKRMNYESARILYYEHECSKKYELTFQRKLRNIDTLG